MKGSSYSSEMTDFMPNLESKPLLHMFQSFSSDSMLDASN